MRQVLATEQRRSTAEVPVDFNHDPDSECFYHETCLTRLTGIMASDWKVLPGHRQGGKIGNEEVAFAHRNPIAARDQYQRTAPVPTKHGTKHIGVQLRVVGFEGCKRARRGSKYQQAPFFKVITLKLRAYDEPQTLTC